MKHLNRNSAAKTLVALCWLLVNSLGLAETKITYLHNDLLGSPVVATDEQGQVVWRKSYAPFGAEETSEGQTQTASRDAGIGYTGHASDKSTGMVYMGSRFYNPQVGVFLSRDPAEVSANDPFSFNRYAYVNNNPYRYRDPNGESPLDIGFFVYDAAKFGMAVYSGNLAAITEASIDLGMSAVGLISPVPGTGLALKASKIARVVDKAEDGVKAGRELEQLASKASGGLCFEAGTPIHTKDGLKPIEAVKVGDLVASKDELTGKVEFKPVVQLFRNENKEILNVTLVSKSGKAEVLGVTPEHPLWVVGKKWVAAKDVTPGDQLQGLKLAGLKVQSIEKDVALHTTYNFEVADYHTYFVGDDGSWVHNSCKQPDLKRIHPDETIKSGSSKYSYEHWSKQTTDDIVKSLKPGAEEALRVKPDGRIFNGNTRTKVLEERGFDINKLVREIIN